MLLTSALLGCVSMKQHRSADTAPFDHETISVDGRSADLFFVEMDDQGWLHDRGQLERAYEHIVELGDTCAEPPPLIIAYAHGWSYSAREGDGNVAEMKESLAYLMTQTVERPRPIVGVYIGWRGKSWHSPFHVLSFWGRKEAAHRIGESGASSIINTLELAKRELIARRGTCDGTDPMLVVAGHSFGGAMIYSAYAQLLGERMRRLSVMDDSDAREEYMRSYTNLVVLFNPAFEAARFEHLTNIPADCEGKPCARMLMTVTSETDNATRKAFPFGRRFGTLWQSGSYRAGDSPPQGKANRTALGHFTPWITHELSLDETTEPEPGCASYRPELAPPLTPLPTVRFCGYELKTLEESIGVANPRLLNVRAVRQVLNKHGLAQNRDTLVRFGWDFIAHELVEHQKNQQ
ncbi:hypothetical protein [Billgrantia montanilacus]|uniref:Alpha/beta hydrolase n=1 Tax=Billgrantia montanilacus TaxID=2282305 RepID=A0A368TZI6_9GAMM|nr:hypothetical protein [Halomonas montanilacus]RCV88343.1 hypothetical protein DU505_13690 [Halomonas montanilacus]